MGPFLAASSRNNDYKIKMEVFSMRKNFKKVFSMCLAILAIASCFVIPTFASTLSGTSNKFGNWFCTTQLSLRSDNTWKYYSSTTSDVPAKLTVESEYQKYPSGERYDYRTKTTPGYDSYVVGILTPKTQQSTVWSSHYWKISSGSGMTKHTQLISS